MKESITIQGYINVAGRDSNEMYHATHGIFVEQIVPKTFQHALMKAKNVDLLLNHDKSRKLGSLKQGNLRLWEDNIGLWAQATITDPEIIGKAEKGELNGWSFTFKSKKEQWQNLNFKNEPLKRRLVSEIDLIEVSILSGKKQPTYRGTSIEVRAMPLPTQLLECEITLLKIKGSPFAV